MTERLCNPDLLDIIHEGLIYRGRIFSGRPSDTFLVYGTSLDGFYKGSPIQTDDVHGYIKDTFKMLPDSMWHIDSVITSDSLPLEKSDIYLVGDSDIGAILRLDITTNRDGSSLINTFIRAVPTSEMITKRTEYRQKIAQERRMTLLKFANIHALEVFRNISSLSKGVTDILNVDISKENVGEISEKDIYKAILKYNEFEQVGRVQKRRIPRGKFKAPSFAVLEEAGGKPMPGIAMSLEVFQEDNRKMAVLKLKKS